jgi:hypothetical protein
MAFLMTIQNNIGVALVIGCDTDAEKEELKCFAKGKFPIDVSGRIGDRKCDKEICTMLMRD